MHLLFTMGPKEAQMWQGKYQNSERDILEFRTSDNGSVAQGTWQYSHLGCGDTSGMQRGCNGSGQDVFPKASLFHSGRKFQGPCLDCWGRSGHQEKLGTLQSALLSLPGDFGSKVGVSWPGKDTLGAVLAADFSLSGSPGCHQQGSLALLAAEFPELLCFENLDLQAVQADFRDSDSITGPR